MYRPKTVVKKPSGAAFRKRKLQAEMVAKQSTKIMKHFLSQSADNRSAAAGDDNGTLSENGENTDELENLHESDESELITDEDNLQVVKAQAPLCTSVCNLQG